jgi:hypothetical protein
MPIARINMTLHTSAAPRFTVPINTVQNIKPKQGQHSVSMNTNGVKGQMSMGMLDRISKAIPGCSACGK